MNGNDWLTFLRKMGFNKFSVDDKKIVHGVLGVGFLFIRIDNDTYTLHNFDEFYEFQAKFWFLYGYEYIRWLNMLNVLKIEDIQQYSSQIFFAPVQDRTEWDITI